MKIKQNLHIHSHHSCDSACAKLPDIMEEMTRFGIEQYCLTDHLHTAYNLSDLVSSRHDYLANRPPRNFHFGVEVSCVAQTECERVAAGDYHAWGDEPVYGFRDMKEFDGRMAIGIDAGTIDDLHLECVVGGVHWPLGNPMTHAEAIRNYFEQQMFLIQHPLVDVLAHPWDSLEMAAGGWFRSRDNDHIDWTVFFSIPEEYNERLGDALVRNHKAAEINIEVLDISNSPEILEYKLRMLAAWKQRGVKFTIGSDLHKAHFSQDQFIRAEKWLSDYGFSEDDFILPFRKFQ